MTEPFYGITGRLLEVNLTSGEIDNQHMDPALSRKYVGGTCLGAAIMCDEVNSNITWSDPDNVLVFASGPLAGTRVRGSSTYSVCTKGPLTNGFAATQANGFFSAFLKHAGFDAIKIKGRASRLSYLYVHNGIAEIRDAQYLAGRDTWETEDLLKKDLKLAKASSSVACIGMAGENKVRFAGIFNDKGHAAAHNGVGAVMGAKNLKAIVINRGQGNVKVCNETLLMKANDEMLSKHHQDKFFETMFNWGTLHLFEGAAHHGRIPYCNYTTSICPMTEEQLHTFSKEYIREHCDVIRRHQCWGCKLHHCTQIRIPNGPLAGQEGEEPEYEGFTSMGSQLGIWDGMTAVSLSNEVDRLGMDVNETGWTLGLAIECFEKGIITTADTDGITLKWGDVESIRQLYTKISQRDGFGNLLAEGAMRAASTIGGDAPQFAVHTMRGNTPLGHDHRPIWFMMLDICVANTGSYELHVAPRAHIYGIKEPHPDSAEDIAEYVSQTKWLTQFIDSLGICRLANKEYKGLLIELLNAATGWDFTEEEARNVGLRALNLMRAFNLRHGFDSTKEYPSSRYGSIPIDGPHQGRDFKPVWDTMLDIYYRNLGWDRHTGKPLLKTLDKLGLSYLNNEIWDSN